MTQEQQLQHWWRNHNHVFHTTGILKEQSLASRGIQLKSVGFIPKFQPQKATIPKWN